MPDFKTGVVTGLSNTLILIDNDRFFLGEQKATDIGVGDKVEWMHNGGSFLTHLVLLAKADGSPVPAQKKKTTKDQGPPPQTCVMGECQDKAQHFIFNEQRNRWECNITGMDNPNISHCPLIPKKVTGTAGGYDENARAAGFGTPPKDKVPVVGVYLSNNDTAIMLKVDGKNVPYAATPDLIKYLRSKDCKAKVNEIVILTIERRKEGSGSWATAIGPCSETGQKPPVETPSQKAGAPAGQPTGSPPPQGCRGCSPNDPDNDCEFCRELQEVDTAVAMHRDISPAILPVQSWSDEEILLIRNTIAKGCTEPEFKLLMYLAKTYGLDPLAKQIWAVKRNDNSPALIFAGRDGLLAIAHRSGKFDGMQSGVKYVGEGKDRKPESAWCEIWRKDMTHSFTAEVPFSEYNTGFSVWKTNPSAMILKVAEAVCLRKAFVISGLYSPEEIDTSPQGR